jgi:hypothetical protein
MRPSRRDSRILTRSVLVAWKVGETRYRDEVDHLPAGAIGLSGHLRLDYLADLYLASSTKASRSFALDVIRPCRISCVSCAAFPATPHRAIWGRSRGSFRSAATARSSFAITCSSACPASDAFGVSQASHSRVGSITEQYKADSRNYKQVELSRNTRLSHEKMKAGSTAAPSLRGLCATD